MNDITCPFCKKKFELSDALRHQIEEAVSKKQQEEYEEKLEKIKIDVARSTERKIKDESLKELEKANKEKQLLEEKLLKEQKDRDEFEKLTAEKAARESAKASRLEKLEYEKKISDMQKSLEEAQRKAKQGSQQLQGEVLELDLENKLKIAFPTDEFVPVPKGVEGGDIWQKVKFQGSIVGSILWETKRTKQWSNLWLNKLKDDAARISASESIIVSQILPQDSQSFDRKDGVWITTYEHATNIARYIRFLITSLSKVKSSASQTDEEWTKVRDYMLSDAFKHRMQAHFDAVKVLRDVLETEKRTSTLRWKRQQAQIDKLDSNTLNLYAELKEIVSKLPELEELEVPLLEEGDKDDQESLL